MPSPDGGRAQGGYWYAAAVRASTLPPSARLLALAIVGQADNETGRLVRSLSALARDTGLNRATVARQLKVLEGGGWLIRSAPPDRAALGAHQMTAYTTVIPPEFPSRTMPLGLVAQSAKPSGTTRHSHYVTKGGGASASAPAPAPPTTREGSDVAELAPRLPPNYDNPCECVDPKTAADDPVECIRCGGAVA